MSATPATVLFYFILFFFFVHFTGFQMDLQSFVIGPSDAQAYSALIAIISLSLAYLLKYFTLSLT